MHAISSYRGNRPTNKQTNKQTNRGDYNALRRSFASAQCNQENTRRFTCSDNTDCNL